MNELIENLRAAKAKERQLAHVAVTARGQYLIADEAHRQAVDAVNNALAAISKAVDA